MLYQKRIRYYFIVLLFIFTLNSDILAKASYRPVKIINPILNDEPLSYSFAKKYTIKSIFNNSKKAEAFERDYLLGESKYFNIARDPQTGITYDGFQLNKVTGYPEKIRFWSAPSKECLDIAICIKALEGNKKASLVLSNGDIKRSKLKALDILDKKINTYIKFYNKNPGFAGFLPWYFMRYNFEPALHWESQIPGLDNGEWAWTMLVAQRALQKAGAKDIAKKYVKYNKMLRSNAAKVFYDDAAGKVRADVWISNPKIKDAKYLTKNTGSSSQPRLAYLTGEDGVHEGSMLLLYISLFADDLPKEASKKIWSGTKMTRIEHKYGTTWRGCWGSAHESWAYLILPFRDLREFRGLFRIREKIRSQNARLRGYPGFATSANKPGGKGYLDGVGIEGVGILPVNEYNDTFAIYGVFPMLLEFSDNRYKNNYALCWLLNMLKSYKMQGPLGGGEASSKDGKAIAYVKTIDGTFPNILALMGGLEKETRNTLKYYGKYEDFVNIVKNEYYEAFRKEPLREPFDFVLPNKRCINRHIEGYISKNKVIKNLPKSGKQYLKTFDFSKLSYIYDNFLKRDNKFLYINLFPKIKLSIIPQKYLYEGDFIRRDARLKMSIPINNCKDILEGEILIDITPFNFSGIDDDKIKFSKKIILKSGFNEVNISKVLNNVKLWWPWNLGSPSLYNIDISIKQRDKVITKKRVRMAVYEISKKGNKSYYLNDFPIKVLPYDIINYNNPLDALRECKKLINRDIFAVWVNKSFSNSYFSEVLKQLGVLVIKE